MPAAPAAWWACCCSCRGLRPLFLSAPGAGRLPVPKAAVDTVTQAGQLPRHRVPPVMQKEDGLSARLTSTSSALRISAVPASALAPHNSLQRAASSGDILAATVTCCTVSPVHPKNEHIWRDYGVCRNNPGCEDLWPAAVQLPACACRDGLKLGTAAPMYNMRSMMACYRSCRLQLISRHRPGCSSAWLLPLMGPP